MLSALFHLTKRNVKIYLKDKTAVFFSLIAPLIVLGLYILFLGRIQNDAVTAALSEAGVSVAPKLIKAFCDSWMLTGLMATACITVALCSAGIIVQDKRRGITSDLAASPVKKWLPTLSYFISTFIVTVIICSIALAVCFIFIAAGGSWYLSFTDVLGIIGTMLLSALSSTMVVIAITSFIKTEGAFSSVNIIMGTVIGFLIGAYMPISTFPKAVQYFTLFIPGSYSAGLFRHFFMGGALKAMGAGIPSAVIDGLAKTYSMQYDFFGLTVNAGAMAVILAASVLLFAAVNLLIIFLKRKKA